MATDGVRWGRVGKSRAATKAACMEHPRQGHLVALDLNMAGGAPCTYHGTVLRISLQRAPISGRLSKRHAGRQQQQVSVAPGLRAGKAAPHLHGTVE